MCACWPTSCRRILDGTMLPELGHSGVQQQEHFPHSLYSVRTACIFSPPKAWRYVQRSPKRRWLEKMGASVRIPRNTVMNRREDAPQSVLIFSRVCPGDVAIGRQWYENPGQDLIIVVGNVEKYQLLKRPAAAASRLPSKIHLRLGSGLLPQLHDGPVVCLSGSQTPSLEKCCTPRIRPARSTQTIRRSASS